MSFHLVTSPRTEDLAYQLESGVASDHLVLVGSQLMERTLRRRLQQVLKGPAPKIRVLANWLEEQALVWGEGDPGIVLGPKDVELLFDYWLEHHDRSAMTLRYPDMVSALSAWLIQTARGSLDLRAYTASDSEILRVMSAFSSWLETNRYRIRESLPGSSQTTDHPRVWLYQVDVLFPIQFAALNRFRDKLTVLLCAPEDASPAYIDSHLADWGHPSQSHSAQELRAPRMEAFSTPQAEVGAVMERLLDRLSDQSGFQLSDAVVLVSDLASYRPHIEAMSRLYGIPTQCSKSDTLRSNPVLNRFNRLLRLRLNGFQITDIMEVFGDKLISYPGVDVTLIRDIHKDCLKWNRRTLKDADAEHLKSLPAMFGSSKPRQVSQWCHAQLELLRRFQTEAEKEVRTRKKQFVELVNEFGATYQRLGLDPVVNEAAFFRMFDQFLSGKSERVEDKPEALLFTEIHHFPDVHGKLAIVIGLADSLHPGHADHPIHSRFGAELTKCIEAFTPDPYLEARHHLERILRSAADVWLSYPKLIADSKTTPSMLWVDTKSRFTNLHPWPATAGNLWDLTVSLIHSGDPLASLLADIGKQRRSLGELGAYDGVLTSDYAKHLALKRIAKEEVIPMSPSRLEMYAKAPFDFMFRYVLKIEEELRFKEDADVKLKGDLLHEILCKFHKLGLWPDEAHFDECLQQIRIIADSVMDARSFELGAADSPFPNLFRRQVHALLPAILQGEITRLPLLDLTGFRPKFLEWEWKFDRELNGLNIRLNGKIDRVDVASSGNEALMIDYKTGAGKQPSIKDIRNGQAFQMALYWWALKHEGLRPIAAAYWKLPIQKGKVGMDWQEVMLAEENVGPSKKHAVCPLSELDAIVETVVNGHVPAIVEAIRNGHFELPLEKGEYASAYALARRFDEPIQMARKGTVAEEWEDDDAE